VKTFYLICGACGHRVRTKDFDVHCERYCPAKVYEPKPTERQQEIAAADLREGLRNAR
jgi:hypothetical protein